MSSFNAREALDQLIADAQTNWTDEDKERAIRVSIDGAALHTQKAAGLPVDAALSQWDAQRRRITGTAELTGRVAVSKIIGGILDFAYKAALATIA